MFSEMKAMTIPEGDVAKIVCNGVTLWEKPPSMKNWAKYSTESDGTTIYNGGLGYKWGYRVRSGGAEGAQSYCVCTGFIPVKPLSVIRISGTKQANTASAINVSDASFANIGQVCGSGNYGIFLESSTAGYRQDTMKQKDGYWEWTVPPASLGVAYIRVTNYAETEAEASKMIVTVDQDMIL